MSLLTWLLLIFAPGWEYLKSAALVAPVINALLYTVSVTYLLAHPAPGDAGLDFGSLGSIVAAFQSPDAVSQLKQFPNSTLVSFFEGSMSRMCSFHINPEKIWCPCQISAMGGGLGRVAALLRLRPLGGLG